MRNHAFKGSVLGGLLLAAVVLFLPLAAVMLQTEPHGRGRLVCEVEPHPARPGLIVYWPDGTSETLTAGVSKGGRLAILRLRGGKRRR